MKKKRGYRMVAALVIACLVLVSCARDAVPDSSTSSAPTSSSSAPSSTASAASTSSTSTPGIIDPSPFARWNASTLDTIELYMPEEAGLHDRIALVDDREDIETIVALLQSIEFTDAPPDVVEDALLEYMGVTGVSGNSYSYSTFFALKKSIYEGMPMPLYLWYGKEYIEYDETLTEDSPASRLKAFIGSHPFRLGKINALIAHMNTAECFLITDGTSSYQIIDDAHDIDQWWLLLSDYRFLSDKTVEVEKRRVVHAFVSDHSAMLLAEQSGRYYWGQLLGSMREVDADWAQRVISKAQELDGKRYTDVDSSWFRVSLPSSATGKPVIYLYPEQTQTVRVALNFDGELSYTYPAYGDGWAVTAHPDGRLVNDADGSEHYYLFWEGHSPHRWNMSEGFCVAGGDTEAFLRDVLPRIGLLPREYNDFITYWVPRMMDNAYNLISFSALEEYGEVARLHIDPQPDSLLRVHMAWRALSEPVDIPPQSFTPFERRGFTVVEWGGTQETR